MRIHARRISLWAPMFAAHSMHACMHDDAILSLRYSQETWGALIVYKRRETRDGLPTLVCVFVYIYNMVMALPGSRSRRDSNSKTLANTTSLLLSHVSAAAVDPTSLRGPDYPRPHKLTTHTHIHIYIPKSSSFKTNIKTTYTFSPLWSDDRTLSSSSEQTVKQSWELDSLFNSFL